MKCKRCGKEIDIKELERTQGKHSRLIILGYCSPQCYTKDVVLKMKDGDKKDKKELCKNMKKEEKCECGHFLKDHYTPDGGQTEYCNYCDYDNIREVEE